MRNVSGTGLFTIDSEKNELDNKYSKSVQNTHTQSVTAEHNCFGYRSVGYTTACKSWILCSKINIPLRG